MCLDLAACHSVLLVCLVGTISSTMKYFVPGKFNSLLSLFQEYAKPLTIEGQKMVSN